LLRALERQPAASLVEIGLIPSPFFEIVAYAAAEEGENIGFTRGTFAYLAALSKGI